MNRPCLCLAALLISFSACDTETIDFGSIDNIEDVVADADQILTRDSFYIAYSCSILMDSVRANSMKCYFGSIDDPETHTDVKAEYACQLHCFEGDLFPDKDSLISVQQSGMVECDSVELLMFYDTWYGDKNSPLKVEVVPLDGAESNLLPQGEVFYTDIDLSKYACKNAAGQDSVMVTKVFTAWDNMLFDSELNDSEHTHCARIALPKAFGDGLMKKYYDNPTAFKDSYSFTHEVCPGFYLRYAGGTGAMVGVTSTSLNVYYRFHYMQMNEDNDSVLVDSVYNAYSNFVGSPEVLQATSFKNEGLKDMLERKSCTYVKSPAGIATEIVLPVDDIFKGHEADSLARVQITLMRYNSLASGTDSVDMAFAPPTTLAMILKSEMKSFFEDGYELSARKYATAQYNSSFNVYDFSNIARLVSYMNEQRVDGDPDWNKVVLIPVTVNTNTASGTVVNVKHDMSLSSTSLVGGDTPLRVNVTYSRYK